MKLTTKMRLRWFSNCFCFVSIFGCIGLIIIILMDDIADYPFFLFLIMIFVFSTIISFMTMPPMKELIKMEIERRKTCKDR